MTTRAPSKMRIALFGGSFDPPHFGHVMTITAALNSGECDQVWLVPSGVHRDKQTHATPEDRKAMIAIMLATMFGSRVPIQMLPLQIEEKERISTSFDLVAALKGRHPDYSFQLVIGSDLVKDVPQWHRAQELQRIVSFLVMPRPGYDVAGKLPAGMKLLSSPGLALTNISSSMVREMIRSGKSLEGIIPPAVISHIIRHNLYGHQH